MPKRTSAEITETAINDNSLSLQKIQKELGIADAVPQNPLLSTQNYAALLENDKVLRAQFEKLVAASPTEIYPVTVFLALIYSHAKELQTKINTLLALGQDSLSEELHQEITKALLYTQNFLEHFNFLYHSSKSSTQVQALAEKARAYCQEMIDPPNRCLSR